MSRDKIEVGMLCIYYPKKIVHSDNLHFPALVEGVGKRIKLRIFMEGRENGIVITASAKRIGCGQIDIFAQGAE